MEIWCQFSAPRTALYTNCSMIAVPYLKVRAKVKLEHHGGRNERYEDSCPLVADASSGGGIEGLREMRVGRIGQAFGAVLSTPTSSICVKARCTP